MKKCILALSLACVGYAFAQTLDPASVSRLWLYYKLGGTSATAPATQAWVYMDPESMEVVTVDGKAVLRAKAQPQPAPMTLEVQPPLILTKTATGYKISIDPSVITPPQEDPNDNWGEQTPPEPFTGLSGDLSCTIRMKSPKTMEETCVKNGEQLYYSKSRVDGGKAMMSAYADETEQIAFLVNHLARGENAVKWQAVSADAANGTAPTNYVEGIFSLINLPVPPDPPLEPIQPYWNPDGTVNPTAGVFFCCVGHGRPYDFTFVSALSHQ